MFSWKKRSNNSDDITKDVYAVSAFEIVTLIGLQEDVVPVPLSGCCDRLIVKEEWKKMCWKKRNEQS